MLVKVRNDDPSRLSATERTVVNWLKSWSGPHAVPGIAIVQCQDADIVVWTPQTSVVVGVHGFTERVTGTLSCAENEPWTVDGKPAPIDGDANPLERVLQQTVGLAGQLRSAPGREHVPVSGLVLLCPQLGSRVKLEKGALPPGIDVLIGDGPSSLRNYFTSLAEGADPSWDAAQVGQALGALGFAAAATYSDLVSEGFPPPDSARTSAPPLSAAPTVVVPSVPVPSPEPPTPPAVPAGPPSGAPAGPLPGARAGRPSGAQPGPGAGRAIPGGAPAGSAGGAPTGPGRDAPPAQQFSQPAGRRPAAGAEIASAAAAAAAYRAVTGGAPAPQQQYAQGGSPQGPSGPPPGAQRPRQFQPQSPQPGWQGGQQSRPQQGGPSPENGPQTSYSGQSQNPAPGFPLWSDPQHPPKAARPRRRRDLPIVGALVLLVLILAVAAMCTGRTTTTNNKPRPAQESTLTHQSTTPTTTDPTIPQTTIAPACFPLQPGC
ncbi:MAG: Translation initiation factor [Nocardia sp.]|uniref:hypothetical protein n=1 Tax=Nocardia sp. TaxID=1821 RepID=UPI00261A25DF|nr:hypothetical protein [Nocardia sp.]MCU1647454.1 Translation initiation factor [Nocardia sp.]